MVREYDESKIPSVYNLGDAPPVRQEPGLTQVVFRGIDQMVGYTVIEPEKEDTPTHTHPWEQVNVLVEGRLDFLIDDERVSLQQYDVLVIPPEVEHTALAVSDEPALLLAMWPLREDLLPGTEYQSEFSSE